MLNFYCSHCGQRIEVLEEHAGKRATCPTCKGESRVPQSTDLIPKTVAAHHQMSLADFYFSFDGRISVEDYWVKGIFVGFAVGVLVVVIDTAIDANGVFYGLFLLASFWPSAALLVKRWHDRDKSGWFYWVLFIPIIGAFWTLVEAGFMRGTKGENRFGPDPIRRRRSATHTATAPEKSSNPIPWIIATCIVLGLLAIAKIIANNKHENRKDMGTEDSALQQEQERTAVALAKANEVEATAAKARKEVQAMEVANREAEARGEKMARELLEKVRLKEERRKLSTGIKPGEEKIIDLTPGLGIIFCWIPPGEFIMGSPKGEVGRSDYTDDENQQKVKIGDGFWMSKYEVTQSVWEAVMGNNPSFYGGEKEKLPVEQVSSNQIYGSNGFIEKINIHQIYEMKFFLPTEEQWEYACRAGTSTSLNNGKNITHTNLLCPNVDEVAWYQFNAYRTMPIGGKKSNSWGLCDMHGNVSEWCDNTKSVREPSSGLWRIRGDSWRSGLCRSASRNTRNAGEKDVGIRLIYKYNESE